LQLNFTNATITNNVAQYGGAILSEGALAGTSAKITFLQSTIANNTAAFNGGGFEILISGYTLISTQFYNNSALTGTGGAIDIYPFSSGTMTLINCNIQSNYASTFGGAIAVEFSLFNVSLQNTTIAQNYAVQSAGGIYIATASTLTIGMTLSSTVLKSNSISTGCIEDVICTGPASLNFGVQSCTNGSTCTFPLVACALGCGGDICNCQYSNILYCNPLTTCPVQPNNNNNTTTTIIIVACSIVAFLVIIIGAIIAYRKYKVKGTNQPFSTLVTEEDE